MRAPTFLRFFVLPAVVFALAATSPPPAAACGGCFHPQGESSDSFVTDHRMVLKVSQKETILWDQVRYAGDPKEFAWVLPVREGAKVELSRDAFITALDASTRTTVDGPERFCNGGFSSSSSSGGCASSSATSLSAAPGENNSSGKGTGFEGDGNVEVLSQSVIGPYQAVTIRAAGGQGIAEWLVANGFAIPANVRPAVDAYTRERFDFIALRLRPGQGVQAMRPVRVVTPGADTTMPLRMVAAGVGARVGLTLWVIGEGRYRTQNFTEGAIDYDKLVWDGRAGRSNLSALQQAALATNDGRSWITEAAIRFSATGARVTERTNVNVMGASPTNPTPVGAYEQQCRSRQPERVRCDQDELPPPDGRPEDQTDAGAGAPDAGDPDASDMDAGEPDAAADASAPPRPAPTCYKTVYGCDGFDDFEVALRGLSARDLWLTRLRADLPVAALDRDLRLEASPYQAERSPQHHTDTFSDPKFDPCEGRGGSQSSASPRDDGSGCVCDSTPRRSGASGSLVLVGATAFAASRLLRRRRRR